MIDLFQEYTYKITEYEKEVVLPILFKGLQKKIGKEKAVTNKKIQEGLLDKYKIKITGPRVRKLISILRYEAMPDLMATSKGYYIATEPEELQRWIKSLDHRERQIATTRQGAELRLVKMLELKNQKLLYGKT